MKLNLTFKIKNHILIQMVVSSRNNSNNNNYKNQSKRAIILEKLTMISFLVNTQITNKINNKNNNHNYQNLKLRSRILMKKIIKNMNKFIRSIRNIYKMKCNN